ncbi:MAG: sulfite exporter TauE/SafE family protein [Oscillospiraceae bacterium]
MICRACEDAIADALLHTRGVISAQAHYWRSRVTITYDPDIVTEDTLRQVLTNAGYPPGAHGMGGVVVDLICLALVGVLYWGLPKLLMLVQVPALAENASLGLVFLVGLLTSTHCIGMCGGILLAQTTDARGVTGRSKRGLIASAAYNGGRVVSYTAVGAVCGALGAVITYTPNIKSMVFTVAGALVLLIGLRMAGILPGLRPYRDGAARRLQPECTHAPPLCGAAAYHRPAHGRHAVRRAQRHVALRHEQRQRGARRARDAGVLARHGAAAVPLRRAAVVSAARLDEVHRQGQRRAGRDAGAVDARQGHPPVWHVKKPPHRTSSCAGVSVSDISPASGRPRGSSRGGGTAGRSPSRSRPGARSRP